MSARKAADVAAAVGALCGRNRRVGAATTSTSAIALTKIVFPSPLSVIDRIHADPASAMYRFTKALLSMK
jgi:hypothetical protein